MLNQNADDIARKTTREKEKRDAFTKLANARLTKAKKAIMVLVNLANKANYSFNAKDHETMVRVLNEHVQFVDGAFKNALTGKAVQATGNGEKFFE